MIFYLSVVIACAQLPSGAVSRWTFGGNVSDIINGHNGTIVGTPTLSTDRGGNPNCAYTFHGDTSEYIRINNHPDFNISPGGAFTIGFWYKGGSLDQGDYEQLFCKCSEPLNGSFGPVQADYSVGLFDLNNPVMGYLFGSTSVSDSVWKQCAAKYNNGKWYLYINAVLVASDTTQQYHIAQQNDNIYIGRGFSGSIDDIVFYSRALSLSEINALDGLPPSCTSVGIEGIQMNEKLSVYPNPNNGKFKVTLNGFKKIVSIQIFNNLGKIVYLMEDVWRNNLTLDPLSICLDVLPGNYIMKVNDEERQFTKLITIE